MTDLMACPTKMADDGLVLADLLTDLVETTDRLVARLAAGDVLDSFLLAAAAVQIVEDDLQRDTLALRRGARYARARGVPTGVPQVLAAAATGCERLRGVRSTDRRGVRWCARAVALRDSLARRVMVGEMAARRTESVGGSATMWTAKSVASADNPVADELADARWLRDQLPGLSSRLRASVLRLPSCFRSFDQHPLDLVTLAERYAGRHPDRRRPVLVVGVRTSGAYLAPLVAAAFRALGYAEVHAETARPEFRLRNRVRKSVRSVAGRGGRVVIVDDPPATGSAIRSVADAAARHGVGGQSVSLLLPLFGEDLPSTLRQYDSILLRHAEWSVHARLGVPSVRGMLAELLGDNGITVRKLDDPAPPDERGHLRTIIEVSRSDGGSDVVVASGAGLGYFGRHALAIARALPVALPATYGFTDGVVFREWLPAAGRLTTIGPDEVPPLVGYIRARAEALPAVADRSVGLAGRQPVWEAASRVLEPGYGRLGVLLRPMLLDPLVRRLCATERPSVIDGATGAAHWFRDASGLRKVDADQRAFANTDLSCYDPVFDLAGIAPGSPDADLVATLRAAMPCDDERFLLYELVHLWDQAREGRAAPRASSRAVQRYVSTALLGGLRTNPAGSLCALDLDGVLESDALGFPIITPTGASALRALIAHGFRPVMVTGRSLAEVRERCVNYGLVGGVAEYGAVAYDHRAGTVRALCTTADAGLLDELRGFLRGSPEVEVDEDYTRVVRAYRTDAEGARRRLPSAFIRQVLTVIDPDGNRLRVVRGDGQTDFVPAGVDKGSGLTALAELLGEPTGQPAAAGQTSAAESSDVVASQRNGHRSVAAAEIALAVGDAEPDLRMFGLARRAFAPANADAAVRAAAIPVGRHGFAAGLSDGVCNLIGHRPGGCPACAAPEPTARGRIMLTLLDAQRAGAAGLPGAVLRGMRELSRGAS